MIPFLQSQKPVQRTRDLQIKQLLDKFSEARVVDTNQFSTTIEIPQSIHQQAQVFFEVVLPQNFPSVRPRLFVKSLFEPNSSKYVLGNGEVAHQKLNTWGVNSSLYHVVLDIFRDFTRESTLKLLPVQPKRDMPPSSGYRVVEKQQMPSTQNTISIVPQNAKHIETSEIQFPPIPNDFEQLNKLTVPEIQQLLNNEQAFGAFFHGLPFVKTITSLISDVENDNLKSAKQKVERDNSLKEKIQALESKKQDLMQLESKYRQLLEDKKKVDARYAPSSVLSKLDDLIEESEHECERITNNFESISDTSTFVKNFLEARKRYHLRKLKRNRFASQYC